MSPQTNLDTPGSGSPSNPGAVLNLLAQAQENTLDAVKRQVGAWNDALITAFITAFDNWATSVKAGRIPNTNPPQPPKGYVVGYFTDPTSGPGALGPYGETPVQWPYPMQGVDPVCPMPAIPPDLTKSQSQVVSPAPVSIDVGQAVNALPPSQDNIPLGFKETGADGSTYQKESRVMPFGTVYIWLRVE